MPAIDAVFLGAQGRAFRVVTMNSAPQAINASRGFARCELVNEMLRRSASAAESRYTASPLTGEPTACADSPITMCESESHPHTPLSCVRFRYLLGYHTRTPRVDKRNIPCSFVPCCEASLQRAKPPEALIACGAEYIVTTPKARPWAPRNTARIAHEARGLRRPRNGRRDAPRTGPLHKDLFHQHPVPMPTRLSHATAACGKTQRPAAPCRVLMEQIFVKWTWMRLYVVLLTVQSVADTFTRT